MHPRFKSLVLDIVAEMEFSIVAKLEMQGSAMTGIPVHTVNSDKILFAGQEGPCKNWQPR